MKKKIKPWYESAIDAAAKAICAACEENPFQPGDCRGNQYRWQDYRDVSLAGIKAYEQAKWKSLDPNLDMKEKK